MEEYQKQLEELSKLVFNKAPSILSFGYDKKYLIIEVNGLTLHPFLFCPALSDRLKSWMVENELNHSEILAVYPYLSELPFLTFTACRKKGVRFD